MSNSKAPSDAIAANAPAARNGPVGGEDAAGNGASATVSAIRLIAARLENCRTRTEGVHTAQAQVHRAQAQVHRAQAQYVASVEYMLEGVFLLRRRMASAAASASGRVSPSAQAAAVDITRLFLLLFPGGSLTPTTLRRYAGTVWLAECEGIAWNDSIPFVHRNGGVARCGDRAPRQLFE